MNGVKGTVLAGAALLVLACCGVGGWIVGSSEESATEPVRALDRPAAAAPATTAPASTAAPVETPSATATPSPSPTAVASTAPAPVAGATTPTRTRTATPKPTPSPTKPKPTKTCDPSYPDFCIPPGPPDLDCPDIGRKNFTVRGPDPHRFDADNDGIGCESN